MLRKNIFICENYATVILTNLCFLLLLMNLTHTIKNNFKMKTFKHEFTAQNIPELNGFLKCLVALKNHLEEVTEFNPEKRYVDAVELLNMIQATSAEIQPLFHQALKEILTTEFKNFQDARNN